MSDENFEELPVIGDVDEQDFEHPEITEDDAAEGDALYRGIDDLDDFDNGIDSPDAFVDEFEVEAAIAQARTEATA